MSAAAPGSLARELGFALGASLVCAAAAAALGFVLDGDATIRTIAAALGAVYLLRALEQNRVRGGRLAAVLVFASGAAAAWLLAPTAAVFVAVVIAMVWLGRALTRYKSVREAAVDLGIVATGVAFAAWAAVRTGSIGLAAWCVLLALALGACMPVRDRKRPCDCASTGPFADALRSAEDALTRLAPGRR